MTMAFGAHVCNTNLIQKTTYLSTYVSLGGMTVTQGVTSEDVVKLGI